jgi:hypothetical protein
MMNAPQFSAQGAFGLQPLPTFNGSSSATPAGSDDMPGRASRSGSLSNGLAANPFGFLTPQESNMSSFGALDPFSHASTSGTRPASPIEESGDDDYSDGEGYSGGYYDGHGMAGASAAERPLGHGQEIPPEYRAEVDRIFFEYLQKICSNCAFFVFLCISPLIIFIVEATDSKGEPIHQTLMMKKMQRLDESPDFRPFKFRIQAFTNGFLEEVGFFCFNISQEDVESLVAR